MTDGSPAHGEDRIATGRGIRPQNFRPPAADRSSPQPGIICVLAAPRTGSNLLCYALENIPGARSVLELFHPRWIGCLDATELAILAEWAGGSENILRWRSAHPGKTLDSLLRSRPPGPLVVKVFPRQLAPRLLQHEVLDRSDTGFVVLTRRPIDSFISMTKASIVKKHHGVDTTALRPSIDPLLFAKWARARRAWFHWLDECLTQHAIQPVRLSYENDLASDPAAAAAAVADRFGFRYPQEPRPPALIRQDREDDYRRRVINWEAFAADVEPELLAWATEPPQPFMDGGSMP